MDPWRSNVRDAARAPVAAMSLAGREAVAPVRVRVALGVVILALVGMLAALLQLPRHDAPWSVAIVTIPLWLTALALLSRNPFSSRRTAALVLGVGAILQVVAASHPPNSSDDYARYLWDGHVQLTGTDPYRYPPSAPELSDLRSAPLFQPAPCDGLYPVPGGCTQINRPTDRTIYPPVAQAAFVLVRLVSGGHGAHDGALPLQIAAALAVLLIGVLMLRRALARGSPVWHTAIWLWSPITAAELSVNAHIDWLGVLLVVLAFEVIRRRPALAGALVGAAAAVKLYPVLVLPALLRRHPLRVCAAALGIFVIGYVPHVLAVGPDVIGYLPGYLNQEGYGSGNRLKLLGVLGRPGGEIVGAGLLIALAWWAMRRTNTTEPERTAVVLVGAAFLAATPDYSWYSVLLVALVAMSGRWEWLPVAIAPTFAYLDFRAFGQVFPQSRQVYIMAAVAFAGLWLIRRYIERRSHRASRLSEPAVAQVMSHELG